MKFSEKLQKLRHEQNLTQDDLAEKIFVTRTAISKWETDNGYPSIESLNLLTKKILRLRKIWNLKIPKLITISHLVGLAFPLFVLYVCSLSKMRFCLV